MPYNAADEDSYASEIVHGERHTGDSGREMRRLRSTGLISEARNSRKLMSKQKRRQRRRCKQLIKRLEACQVCGYLAAITNLLRAKQSLGNAGLQCPACRRELLVPMRPDAIGQDVFEKSLRAAGELMRDPARPRPTHFRFLLNDEQIFADLGSDDPGEDDVVCTVKFEVSQQEFTKFKSL